MTSLCQVKASWLTHKIGQEWINKNPNENPNKNKQVEREPALSICYLSLVLGK